MDVRLLIVEDHAPLRQAVRSLLDAEPDMTVIGEAEDGESAIDLAAELTPDVVVMALGLPGITGIEATRQIIAHDVGCAMVVLSGHTDRGLVEAATAAGASAYVATDTASRDLVEAVRAVLSGKGFASPQLIQAPFDG